MAFFLLGQYPDGRLVLLSDQGHATRQDAMGALSILTADPGFEHWDAEVTVHELSTGTPVLMVRPASAPAPEPEADEPEAEEPEIEAELTDEEPEADAAEPEVEIQEPEAEAEREPEAEPEPDDEALAAVMQDLEDEPEAASSLKDALLKTKSHMEAQGVVVPESVGPAEPSRAEEPAVEEPAEEPQDEPAAEGAPEDDAPAAAWPWATNEMPPVGAPIPESTEAPVDEAPAAVSVFELDALESPGDDEGSLVRAPGDAATMAASRPVIMGSYDEAPAPVPEPKPETAPSDSTSDFILDLEEIAAAGPVQTAPEPEVERPDMSSLTCNDCVYVENCPNKGQLAPASCGSFQWK